MELPIYVFVRHCGVSANSINKSRPEWFSKEIAFKNLLATKDENTHVYVMLDTASTDNPKQHFAYHYCETHNVIVVPLHGGSDAHSFINMIEYICGSQSIPNDSIVYLLEDDYVHTPGWCTVMREAFASNIADYVTLYDHPDKYFDTQMYHSLHSRLMLTPNCHWRTTPSTTNTYAMTYTTLKESKEDHLRFSCKVVGFTFDHAKFLFFNNVGKRLVSPIPGFSTHVENEMMSPLIDWESVVKNNLE